jgi:hypothetical protein
MLFVSIGLAGLADDEDLDLMADIKVIHVESLTLSKVNAALIKPDLIQLNIQAALIMPLEFQDVGSIIDETSFNTVLSTVIAARAVAILHSTQTINILADIHLAIAWQIGAKKVAAAMPRNWVGNYPAPTSKLGHEWIILQKRMNSDRSEQMLNDWVAFHLRWADALKTITKPSFQ